MTDLVFTKTKAEHLRNAMDELLLIRNVLRKYVPDYKIDNAADKTELDRAFKKMAKWLVPVFEELGLCQERAPDLQALGIESPGKGAPMPGSMPSPASATQVIETGIQLIQIIDQDFVFIASNSVKKKLKNLGLDAQRIIVAGGPLTVEDMKELNPKIPDAALENYRKKLDNLLGELKTAFGTGKKVYIAINPQDPTDKLMLKRTPDLEHTLGAKLIPIVIKNWDKI